jgi:glycine/D-amino acid oxidase-like deaminating enzyme
MVVIIGAGIAGAATAYYLSTSPQCPSITILDAAEGPARGSSGGAGAFVTNRPRSRSGDLKRQALFEQSFELHQQLAKDLQLKSFCPVHY